MALVNGNDYDHIDLQAAAGGDVTRHMLKDAKAREDVSALKSALIQDYANVISIEQGYWAGADGSAGDSAAWCRTNKFVNKDSIVKTTTSYMWLLAYNKTSGAYVGEWNGSQFSTTHDSNMKIKEFDIADFVKNYPNYVFVIDFKRSSGNITPSDIYAELTVESKNEKSISELKNASVNSTTIKLSWQQGGLNGSTGAEASASSKIRTVGFFKLDYGMKITVPSGLKASVFRYTTANYNSFEYASADWITGTYEFVDNVHYLKILLSYDNNANITPDVGWNNIGQELIAPLKPANLSTNNIIENGITTNQIQWQFGKLINYSGNIQSSDTFALSQCIFVNPGDTILSYVDAYDENGVLFYYGIHQLNGSTWIRTTDPGYGKIFNVPDGVNVVRFVFGRNGSTGIKLTQDDINTYANIYIMRKSRMPLEGKRVSLIGASDSTLVGFIPSGNKAYYTGSNYGVTTVGNCWWYIGITNNGGIPLINDSWSGTTVADILTPTASDAKTPFVSASRCQNLHAYQHNGSSSDTLVTAENIDSLRLSPWDENQTPFAVGEYVKEIDPDVIIVNGGGNDYIAGCQLGTYDGHTPLSSDAVTTFREAYANLINRIQSRYPNALVICCLPIYLVRPDMSSESDKAQVNVNSSGLTYKDYIDVIRDIALLKGCPVIDGFTHGFSRYNYGLFCSDSETGPIHPNALGHLVYGDDFAKNLSNCVRGIVDF